MENSIPPSPRGRSGGSSISITSQFVSALEQLKQLAEKICQMSISELMEGKAWQGIVSQIQSMYTYKPAKEYVTKLLFVFAPISRMIEYYHHEVQKEMMEAASRRPLLNATTSAPNLHSLLEAEDKAQQQQQPSSMGPCPLLQTAIFYAFAHLANCVGTSLAPNLQDDLLITTVTLHSSVANIVKPKNPQVPSLDVQPRISSSHLRYMPQLLQAKDRRERSNSSPPLPTQAKEAIPASRSHVIESLDPAASLSPSSSLRVSPRHSGSTTPEEAYTSETEDSALSTLEDSAPLLLFCLFLIFFFFPFFACILCL
jgi:hypothetical protein